MLIINSGAMPMVGTMPRVPMMPPTTVTSVVNAPAKPLFPAAVAQVFNFFYYQKNFPSFCRIVACLS